MCGIAGFFNPFTNYLTEKSYYSSILEHMNEVQKHRGPDGQGIFLEKHVGFAHVRLSIIDLSNGQQPFHVIEEGYQFTIIYNGELYNMKEVRLELKQRGVTFDTNSDTEVILRAYMNFGYSFIKHLNGIFSFAIWDPTKDKCLLYRDHLGVKPLFYTMIEDTLIFSSEIKGLFQFPGFKPVINDTSMREVFGLGPAKTPGKGVFKDVYELLPGHFMEYSKQSIRDVEYWCLKSVEHTDSFNTTAAKTRRLLKNAIEGQMLSDIPICTFLSGGIDSSLITAVCAHKLAKENKQLNTFSFEFLEGEKYFHANSYQPSLDAPYANLVVAASKTNHRVLTCDSEQQIDRLYACVDARDLPNMADVESSLNYFCRQVVPYNKVVLTGECADEIFGGYPWFHKEECFQTPAFPWSMEISPREQWLKEEVKETLNLQDYVRNTYELAILQTPLLPGENPEEKCRREIAYLNLRWFMVTLLDRMDRTSMNCGLEARVPFADVPLLEYVWNVPWEFKCPNGLVKGLLRKASEGLIPDEVLYRKKSPYPKTYHPHYELALTTQLKEILHSPNAKINTYLNQKKVLDWLNEPTQYHKPFYGQLMAKPQQIGFLLQVNYWLEAYGK